MTDVKPLGIRANGNGSKPWVNDHWESHAAVRSRHELTIGERAADFMKHWFGTWTALFAVALWIASWMVLQKTGISWDKYPYALLNLCLSCIAAVQGIVLQIAANRGDRISSEVSRHTEQNTDKLISIQQEILDLQHQQLEILDAIHVLSARIGTQPASDVAEDGT